MGTISNRTEQIFAGVGSTSGGTAVIAPTFAVAHDIGRLHFQTVRQPARPGCGCGMTSAEQQAVISVITLSFSTDPAARWVYADPGEYLAHMPDWVNAFGGRALDHASAWYVEGFLGAALWLPPGIRPDDDALSA